MHVDFYKPTEIDKQHEHLAEMHSFLNIFNVLTGELHILQKHFRDNPDTCCLIGQSAALVQSWTACLTDPQQTLNLMRTLDGRIAELSRSLCQLDLSLSSDSTGAYESIDNVYTILVTLRQRTREYLVYRTPGRGWRVFETRDVIGILQDFLGATSQVSVGNWAISFDASSRRPTDYLVKFDFPQTFTVRLPHQLPDVMRDLVANSRKYSDPGTDIYISLKTFSDRILLVVRDNGWGIPEADLPNVCNFSFRARNVSCKGTKGGGFGLTKALLMVSKHNGCLSVDSQEHVGTTITIDIPT